MPLIPLLLMTCLEMNLAGFHRDLQMLFHLCPLFLYKRCDIFDKLGGGLRIPHMCGIRRVTRWQHHGCQLGVTWQARGMPVVGAVDCEGEGCASPMWLVDSE